MYSKTLAWLLWCCSIFIGGLHRFYLGKPLTGVLYFLTFNFFGVGLIIDAFALNDMVDAANLREGQRRLMFPDAMHPNALPAPPRQNNLLKQILKAAHKRGGMISLTEAVMETGRTFAEVENELNTLLKDGHCSIDNHPETGVVVYRFPELETSSGSDVG